jgi:hypothetical protein
VLARALVALGRGEFRDACSQFEEMRRANDHDFIPWFGLGQCRSMDSIVVADTRSPSGWSFRSSQYRAAEAYAHAFKLAPALHRGVSAGGYRRLRELIFAADRMSRQGMSVSPDTLFFLSRPEWRGDSLAFVPYPRDVVAAGRAHFDPIASTQAVQHQRAMFIDIARSWASALPNSSGTKEALAIALEMLGDPAAIDTIRSARRLAVEDVARSRLAAQEAFLRLEFARLSDSLEMRAVRLLADSIFRALPKADGDLATALSPLAALLGRCGLAAHLTARGSPTGYPAATFDSIGVLIAAACAARYQDDVVVRGLSARNVAHGRAQSADAALVDEYELLGQGLSLAFPNEPARVARLADVSGDYLLRLEKAAHARDTATVRSILERQRSRRDGGMQRVSPDARLVEARVWLAVGDTTHARVWLDPVLERTGLTTSIPYDAVSVASLLNAIVLRTQLVGANDNARLLNDWSMAIATLWATADPPLQAVAGQLSSSVRR